MIWLIVGLILGATIGFLAAALLAAADIEDIE